MFFRQIEDRYLSQYAYLIGCQRTGDALLIDPERDIDQYIALAEKNDLHIVAVAETHIHADFLSGAREFATFHKVKAYLSDTGTDNWKYEWANDNRLNVQLLDDGDTFEIGNIQIQAIATPGHTPEHLTFLITDRGGNADAPMGVISGDFIFVGDVGRPDLLETAAGEVGSMKPAAGTLYDSLQRFQSLDDYLQVWPGHGAGSACGKALGAVPETTVGYEKRFSPAFEAARNGKKAFIEFILEGQPAPPTYFARMKKLNRAGPPLLRNLPQPPLLNAGALAAAVDNPDAAILDLRTDRQRFAQSHLPGAIFAPFEPSFTTIAGSYVEPDQPIYLLLKEEDRHEAVRSLVRIGLDNVKGYATLDVLDAYANEGHQLTTTKRITFEDLEAHQGRAQIVDVRSPGEFHKIHIPGAHLAPHTRLQEEKHGIPQDKPLIVHCGSGVRASSATSYLNREGFDATMVDDAFSNWIDENRTTTT